MDIPLALYVHLPWCVTQCPYCDFNAHRRGANFRSSQKLYTTALIRELDQRLPLVVGRKISSIYFGGGTPNLFVPGWYATILSRLRQDMEVSSDCEITLEANPGDGRVHDFSGYADAGINRVSLGVQSFNQDILAQLGRDYVPDKAVESIQALLASPIKRYNLDLIFAAPNQSLDLLEKDIAIALTFAPTHLSCYELTIEPNTVFYSHPPDNLPNDDCKSEMFDLVEERLTRAGLQRYEISAYAAAGEECRHNLNYWQFGDYLALGAGAHAKITNATQQQLLRYANQRNPDVYSSLISFGAPQAQDQSEYFFQFCLNAFRLVGGFSVSQSAARLFTTSGELLAKLDNLVGKDFFQLDGDWVTLKREAWLQQNQFLSTIV